MIFPQHRQSRPSIGRAAAGGLILALYALPAVAVEPEPVPSVEIEFLIEKNSELDETLSRKEARERVRDRVRQELLASFFKTHFGFLDWRLAGSESGGTDPIPRLTVTLQDEQADFGSRNFLKFTGTIGSPEVDLRLVPKIQVYDEFARSKDDPGEIERKILDAVLKHDKPDHLKKRLHESFMSKIPLSREVFGDEANERVYVDLDWGQLKAASDSTLSVEFKKEDQRGILRISSLKERSALPIPGSVEGGVWFYDLAPTLVSEPGHWPPSISQDLEAASEMTVLMKEYAFASPVGLVSSPNSRRQ